MELWTRGVLRQGLAAVVSGALVAASPGLGCYQAWAQTGRANPTPEAAHAIAVIPVPGQFVAGGPVVDSPPANMLAAIQQPTGLRQVGSGPQYAAVLGVRSPEAAARPAPAPSAAGPTAIVHSVTPSVPVPATSLLTEREQAVGQVLEQAPSISRAGAEGARHLGDNLEGAMTGMPSSRGVDAVDVEYEAALVNAMQSRQSSAPAAVRADSNNPGARSRVVERIRIKKPAMVANGANIGLRIAIALVVVSPASLCLADAVVSLMLRLDVERALELGLQSIPFGVIGIVAAYAALEPILHRVERWRIRKQVARSLREALSLRADQAFEDFILEGPNYEGWQAEYRQSEAVRQYWKHVGRLDSRQAAKLRQVIRVLCKAVGGDTVTDESRALALVNLLSVYRYRDIQPDIEEDLFILKDLLAWGPVVARASLEALQEIVANALSRSREDGPNKLDWSRLFHDSGLEESLREMELRGAGEAAQTARGILEKFELLVNRRNKVEDGDYDRQIRESLGLLHKMFVKDQQPKSLKSLRRIVDEVLGRDLPDLATFAFTRKIAQGLRESGWEETLLWNALAHVSEEIRKECSEIYRRAFVWTGNGDKENELALKKRLEILEKGMRETNGEVQLRAMQGLRALMDSAIASDSRTGDGSFASARRIAQIIRDRGWPKQLLDMSLNHPSKDNRHAASELYNLLQQVVPQLGADANAGSPEASQARPDSASQAGHMDTRLLLLMGSAASIGAAILLLAASSSFEARLAAALLSAIAGAGLVTAIRASGKEAEVGLTLIGLGVLALHGGVPALILHYAAALAWGPALAAGFAPLAAAAAFHFIKQDRALVAPVVFALGAQMIAPVIAAYPSVPMAAAVLAMFGGLGELDLAIRSVPHDKWSTAPLLDAMHILGAGVVGVGGILAVLAGAPILGYIALGLSAAAILLLNASIRPGGMTPRRPVDPPAGPGKDSVIAPR